MKVVVPVDMTKAVLASSLTDINPAAWSAATAYTAGTPVTHSGWVYRATQDHTAKYPDREPEFWSRVHVATPDVWSATTTYAVGTKVSYARKIWTSMKDANTAYVPGTAPEWWESIGPVNSWAAFDAMINTKSAALDELQFELDFSGCTALALFGVEGGTVSVRITNSRGDTVDSRSWSMAGLDPRNWLEYFLEPRTPREEVMHTDFPLMAYSRLTLTISAPGGIARLGHVVMGRGKYLGATQYGAEMGISDYSRKSTDSFGNTYLAAGSWAKTTRMDLHVMNGTFDDVYRTLAKLRATPTVFLGDNRDAGFDALTVWGYCRDFRMVIEGPTASQCALEIQGLI